MIRDHFVCLCQIDVCRRSLLSSRRRWAGGPVKSVSHYSLHWIQTHLITPRERTLSLVPGRLGLRSSLHLAVIKRLNVLLALIDRWWIDRWRGAQRNLRQGDGESLCLTSVVLENLFEASCVDFPLESSPIFQEPYFWSNAIQNKTSCKAQPTLPTNGWGRQKRTLILRNIS